MFLYTKLNTFLTAYPVLGHNSPFSFHKTQVDPKDKHVIFGQTFPGTFVSQCKIQDAWYQETRK